MFIFSAILQSFLVQADCIPIALLNALDSALTQELGAGDNSVSDHHGDQLIFIDLSAIAVRYNSTRRGSTQGYTGSEEGKFFSRPVAP